MKNPVLGLALSAVAFGASTVYLWVQLDATQKQAESLDKANTALTARVAELQKRRDDLAYQRQVAEMTGNGAGYSRAYHPGPPTPGDGPPPPDENDRRGWSENRHGPASFPEMPEAMRKMMRTNMRAQNKRLYFDLQAKLGLTDEQTNQMLDLLTDQQTAGFRGPRNRDPDQARDYWEQQQAKTRTSIADLLGESKAVEFEEYQKTMSSRTELMMISQQLEGVETPLNDSQRTKLLDALVAERERIPAPTYSEGSSQEDMMKAYTDWQTDYNKRVADAARSILTTEQLNTYTEYQQWQEQMRQQFGTPGPGVGPRMRGNAVFLPGGPVGTVSVAIENAPSPTEKGANSK